MKWKWGSGLRRGSVAVNPEPAKHSRWGWCSWCAACALPLAAVGRCWRPAGRRRNPFWGSPSGRPLLFPFVCTFPPFLSFFFLGNICVLHFPEAVILHKPLGEVHPFPLPKSPYQTLVTCR